jgi:hypothetical protein
VLGAPRDVLDAEWVQRQLEAHPWKFARTMARTPHWYTLRHQWDEFNFLRVVRYIREHGYQARFGSRTYTYLDAGEYAYWSMPDEAGQIILINRALKETVRRGA